MFLPGACPKSGCCLQPSSSLVVRLLFSLASFLYLKSDTIDPMTLLEVKNLTLRRDDGKGTAILNVSHPRPTRDRS